MSDNVDYNTIDSLDEKITVIDQKVSQIYTAMQLLGLLILISSVIIISKL